MRRMNPHPAIRTRNDGLSAATLAQPIILGGRSLAAEISARLDRLADRVVLFRW